MTALARLQRWTRDDWVIPVSIKDSAGQPKNMAGYVVGAELFYFGQSLIRADLTVGNQGIQNFVAGSGSLDVVVSRFLTAGAPIDADAASPLPTRILIYYLDTLLRRQTIGVAQINVFDSANPVIIDETGGVTILWQDTYLTIEMSPAQGLAGPSNIPSAQITDATDLGREVLQGASAAVIRALLGSPAIGATDVQDADYVIQSSDFQVRNMGTMTAPRTWTLPNPAQYPKGQTLKITDLTGNVSAAMPLTLQAPAGVLIRGENTAELVQPWQNALLEHNSVNRWAFG